MPRLFPAVGLELAVYRRLIATVVKERVSLSFPHGIYPERGI